MAIRLKAVPHNNHFPVIGIFDFDSEGINKYKLNNNFREISFPESTIKAGIHGRVYAFTLPGPGFRIKCTNYKNLPIEFMFSDDCLVKKVQGKSLGLKPMQASRKLGNQTIRRDLGDGTHFKEVVSGKDEFARIVVPTFSSEDFVAFHSVFALIEGAIGHSNEDDSES